MFSELKALFDDLAGGLKQSPQFADNDYRVAAAALMVHVATLDGELSETERQTLHELLKTRFALSDGATAKLIDVAIAADREAVDFYRFTSLLMRELDEVQRRRIIAMMWDMAFADGQISEFEDNVMWRIADLLAVPNRERIELRRDAALARGQSEPSEPSEQNA